MQQLLLLPLLKATTGSASAAAAHSGALGVVGQRAVQEPKLRRRRGEKARDSIEAAGAAVSRHRVRGCVGILTAAVYWVRTLL